MFCRHHGILFMVDAAQTAGVIPIDMGKGEDRLRLLRAIRLLAPREPGVWSSAKGWRRRAFNPWKGGTGSRSEFEEQPDFLPDLCESGTPNTVGLAGLRAGLDFILGVGIEKIRDHERKLTSRLIQGLLGIPGALVYGSGDAEKQCATVSFNLEDWAPSELSFRLDEEFGILTRVVFSTARLRPTGRLGPFPDGTVRVSMSYLNTEEEIGQTLEAIRALARKGA